MGTLTIIFLKTSAIKKNYKQLLVTIYNFVFSDRDGRYDYLKK